MTHEYIIGVGGHIEAAPGRLGQVPGGGHSPVAPTAIAWAADHILAVGSDEVVRAISRGDSTFFDLGGTVVTALPADLERADALLARAASAEVGIDVATRLTHSGLLDAESTIEPGSRADLAFWRETPASPERADPWATRLLAVVRDGLFTSGDPRRGPFPPASDE